ncbi:unnamed protein product [Linum tenue]|uniref:RNA helicase n=1 Tax=Linum tenue TaxID=586396 RepID=A0AAV0HXN1_9ROSI|nr:unnamed protein product [Linum tenue]
MSTERKRNARLFDVDRSSVSSEGYSLDGKLDSQRHSDILQKRETLPVRKQKNEFLDVLKKNQVIILVGQTGSGKTTQIPQFVLEAVEVETSVKRPKMMVACTQPCPVAAVSASQRVAEEMNVIVGEEVGYSICFEDNISDKTVLKYLTDGMLLREAMAKPLLEMYRVIIIDEAHERTLATSVLFGYLKLVLGMRPDLKLVVMSATVEAKLQDYFDGAPLMKIYCVHHPVDIFYTMKPESDFLGATIRSVVEIHQREEPGDILAFLTRQEEIEEACHRISEEIGKLGNKVGPVEIVYLHSTLPPDMQQKIFEPAPPPLVEDGPPGRKIVVSTITAETSLSIDRIAYVIDPGVVEQKFYDSRVGVKFLMVSPVSRDRADMRASLAGRTVPGKCFRLYTERSYNQDRHAQTDPEILRSDLGSIVLILKKLEVPDLRHFMNLPAEEALTRALKELSDLGALDDKGNLTKLGNMMSKFPLDPQMAKMLVVSPGFNCSNEILSICAMLSVPNCFREGFDKVKARFVDTDGDYLTLLNVYNEFKRNKEDLSWCDTNFINYSVLKSAQNVRQHLVQCMSRCGIEMCRTYLYGPEYYDNISKAILAGYFMQVAHLECTGDYLTVKGNQYVHLHPSNFLGGKPEWVVYHEIVSTSMNFIRTAMDVRGEWLVDIAPPRYYLKNFPNSEAKQILELLEKWKEEQRKWEREESKNKRYVPRKRGEEVGSREVHRKQEREESRNKRYVLSSNCAWKREESKNKRYVPRKRGEEVGSREVHRKQEREESRNKRYVLSSNCAWKREEEVGSREVHRKREREDRERQWEERKRKCATRKQ